MSERRRRRRLRPLPEPAVFYDTGDQYPDRVILSFPNGHTVLYDRRVNQPAPDDYINYPKRRIQG